jgi:hypothetical protein
MSETIYKNSDLLRNAQLAAIVNAATETYQLNGNKPIRILDLATGPNGFNPIIINNLSQKGINYELVLSDISPTHFIRGYEKLTRELSEKDLEKVKCVLVDSGDLRRNLKEVPLWGTGIVKLEDVLKDPKYKFLQTGHKNGTRIIDFSDNTFDLVIGCIPYGSINTRDYSDALMESVRVLRKGGYHIVDEMQVEKINPEIERTKSALQRAKVRFVDNIRTKLDTVLRPIAVYSTTYVYNTEERNPEQTIQAGDTIKLSVLIHQK